MLRHQWTFRFHAEEVMEAAKKKIISLEKEKQDLDAKNQKALEEGLELSRTDSGRVSSLERMIETYSQWVAALALRGRDTLALQIDDVVFFELEKKEVSL
jgi:hypothetical protein